jgi:hypothetical protein
MLHGIGVSQHLISLMQLCSLVRVDIFNVEVALVASAYWLFDDVSDGPVEQLFPPQITVPMPHLSLTADVQAFE